MCNRRNLANSRAVSHYSIAEIVEEPLHVDADSFVVKRDAGPVRGLRAPMGESCTAPHPNVPEEAMPKTRCWTPLPARPSAVGLGCLLSATADSSWQVNVLRRRAAVLGVSDDDIAWGETRLWIPRVVNHVERKQSMAATTRPGPLAEVRLIHFVTKVMASSAAHTAEGLAELAAATSRGRNTA